MRTGELFVSKDRSAGIAYKLSHPVNLQGQSGWSCTVYQKLIGKFYVCMRGMIADESGQLTELYTGQGFISGEAIEEFCELGSDIMLMEPIELQNAPSRN